jgi:hypothetical protein
MKTQKNNGVRGNGNKAIKGTISAVEYRDQLRAEIPIPLWAASVQGNRAPLAVSKDKIQDRLAGKGSKIGKAENYQDTQKRHDERHPFARLASFVGWRILNPGISAKQRNATPVRGKGTNGKQRKIKGYSQNVTFSGYEVKKLSATDRAELTASVALAAMAAPIDPRSLVHSIGIAFRGEIDPIADRALAPGGTVSALAPAMHAQCLPCRIAVGCHKFNGAEWKQIFTAARATLGIKRGTARGTVKIESMESEATQSAIDRASLVASIEKECDDQREEQRAHLRSDLAVAMRSMHAKVTRSMHAQRDGGVREWIANWKRAIRHVRTALRASLGNGHGNNSKTTQAEHMRALRFRQYLAHGVRAEVTQAPALACVSLDSVCD